MSKLEQILVDYPEPHLDRMRKILAAHPEVSKLLGYYPPTFFWIVAVVALQVVAMIGFSHAPFWLMLVGSYAIGACANHALFVFIHECTHNLVFKGKNANSALQIFANLPIVFPSAMSFRIYHIQHHLHQGDFDKDADLPRPFEADFIGNTFFGKASWLLFFFVSQIVRVPYMKGMKVVNAWVIANWIVEVSFLATMTYFFGWYALAYLFFSSIFSIGLHPLGARWIQEHYVVKDKQETYSYYGPANTIAFNVGYHNEHHDFMRVPWVRLPKVRALAPEFYDTLHYHTSWSALLWQFLTDPKLSLASRVVRRPGRAIAAKEPSRYLNSQADGAPSGTPVTAT